MEELQTHLAVVREQGEMVAGQLRDAVGSSTQESAVNATDFLQAFLNYVADAQRALHAAQEETRRYGDGF